jgi:hypothetical protein
MGVKEEDGLDLPCREVEVVVVVVEATMMTLLEEAEEGMIRGIDVDMEAQEGGMNVEVVAVAEVTMTIMTILDPVVADMIEIVEVVDMMITVVDTEMTVEGIMTGIGMVVVAVVAEGGSDEVDPDRKDLLSGKSLVDMEKTLFACR